MKKYFWTAPLSLIAIPLLSLAETCPEGQFCNPASSDTFEGLVVAVANLVTQIAIPIVVIFIIYAGFLFVSARGNTTQLTKAKETFYWTIIGALIVVGANFLARATVNLGQSLGNDDGSNGSNSSSSSSATGFTMEIFSNGTWAPLGAATYQDRTACETAANSQFPGKIINDTTSPVDGAVHCKSI